MNAITSTRTLLQSAKAIAQEELDAPNTEAILAVFYRLCLETDRFRVETGDESGDETGRLTH